MSVCPKCTKEIQIQQNQFGSLYTCPACTAVFFVDWDGNPEPPLDSQSLDFSTPPVENSLSSEQISTVSSFAESEDQSQSGDFASQNWGQSFTDNSANANQTVGTIGSSPDLLEDSRALEPSSALLENEVLQEDPVDFERNELSSLEETLGEVLDFANAPEARPLKAYQVEIRGLDLEKEINKLRDILRDPKFRFDVDAVLRGISHGKLVLTDLTSIKAAILVHRLEMEHFKVKVSIES